jgi:hypothetical protein
MILDSSMVEHTAVNRGVVGSSPTRGVKDATAEEAVASLEKRSDCKGDRILEKARVVREENSRKIRLHGQAVKTSPFHGGNTGSIPVGVI